MAGINVEPEAGDVEQIERVTLACVAPARLEELSVTFALPFLAQRAGETSRPRFFSSKRTTRQRSPSTAVLASRRVGNIAIGRATEGAARPRRD